MTTPLDLVNLGVQPFVANRLGTGVGSVVVGGGSVGSATQIPGGARIAWITGSNAGSGLVLPTFGGEIANGTGALGGDSIVIFNLLSASIVVYAPGTMSFIGDGASTAGSVGISVAASRSCEFYAITASTYGVLKSLST